MFPKVVEKVAGLNIYISWDFGYLFSFKSFLLGIS
jgi:hypothetical protein